MQPTAPRGLVTAHAVLALVLTTAAASAQQPETGVACDVEPVQIAYGQHTNGCSLSPSTDTDLFEFEGVAGEEIWILIDAISSNLDPSLRLLDPLGSFVDIGAGTTSPLTCANGCTLVATVTLPLTGIYTMILTDVGNDETGNYRLQLERIPPIAAAPPALLNNVPMQDLIDFSTDVDFFAFAANAGDLLDLKIDAISSNLDPELRILDPSGAMLPIGGGSVTTLWCANGCTLTYSWTVASTGTHTVVLNDVGRDEGGTYSIGLQCLFGTCPPPPFQNYGMGLAGTGAILPTISGAGDTTLGGSVTVSVADGLGGTPGVIVLSTGQASIPIFGGDVLVFPLLHLEPILLDQLGGGAGAGGAAWGLGLPSTPGLVGASVYFQAGLFDAGAAQSIALTNGLKMTFGA